MEEGEKVNGVVHTSSLLLCSVCMRLSTRW